MQKIIIIEDNASIQEELVILLNRYGYEAKGTQDFEHIMKFIEDENPDLILIDINLPVYDGFYICKNIRTKSDVPIIIVTSRNTDIDELISLNLGANDFVTKPYNTDILLARINLVLKKHSNLGAGSSPAIEILSYGELVINMNKSTMRNI